MTERRLGQGLAVAYAATIFLSAFLLFQVQPLIGKYILPWFGGSPAVWTTCMLVFQVLLFAGYAYAHFTTQFLTARQQGYLHVALLIVALVTLPITPDPSWKPTNSDWPVFKIIVLTISSVGLPYFILSSTGPLVQGWFSRTHAGQSPYRLYSLSNLGSLLALISYPFVVEPSFSTATQSILWSVLFGAFAVLCSGCAVIMWQRAPSQIAVLKTAQVAVDAVRPSWNLQGLWFGLAMTASVLLLATTNQVCLDVAVIPFLWIIPLALYLLTFILCFDSDRWYSRRVFMLTAIAATFGSIYVASLGARTPLMLQVAVYFAAMFCCCMVCHGELVKLKPDPKYLTGYFLTISAGGASGGLFVGLLAPFLFMSYYELQFGIFGFASLYLCIRLREDNVRFPLPNWVQPLLVPAALILTIGILSQFDRHAEGSIAVSRNFYGVLKVQQRPHPLEDQGIFRLVHGRIEHGVQFVAPEKRNVPTSYYSESTGIGQVLNRLRPDQPRHVGVIGLGVGTLTAYGKAGDRFRLYEINPDVITIARKHFSFLNDCPADISIVTGDARLALEFESPQEFDVLVVDAFSGDAIPVHLLTKEALAVYLKHLKPDGLLAIHISNLHFDLQPVVAGTANELGLTSVFRVNDSNAETAGYAAMWALVTRNSAILIDELGFETNTTSTRKPIVWTDDRSNLFEILQ